MIRDNNGVNEIALVNIFKSINGEGYASGKPTVFIRVVGCNLRCSYCDTRESWDLEHYKCVYKDKEDFLWLSAQEIFNRVEQLEQGWLHKSICLTGGEPLHLLNKNFMLNELIPLFVEAGYDVGIETDGGIDYTDYKRKFGDPIVTIYGDRVGVTIIADYKLPHSGMNHMMIRNNFKLYSRFDLVKMVISDDEEDWEELDYVVKKSGTKASIYLSPCFGEVTMTRIPEYVMNNPQYNIRAQIQIHKCFWDPTEKDV